MLLCSYLLLKLALRILDTTGSGSAIRDKIEKKVPTELKACDISVDP